MAGLPDSLRCLFSAEIEYRDGSYVLEVPEREIQTRTLAEGEVYRVAVHERRGVEHSGDADAGRSLPDRRPAEEGSDSDPGGSQRPAREPPVEEGERRQVTVEGVGDGGDGIVKLDGGYVLVVPGTAPGDRVEVEVTTVTPAVGFTEVVDEDPER